MISPQTPTGKPSVHILELACPKCPYFTYTGKSQFHFIDTPLKFPGYESGQFEEVVKLTPPLRQVEAARPTPISCSNVLDEEKRQKVRLVVFRPPFQERERNPCSKRVRALATPRQNRMEIRKEQIDQYNKIYTVPKSALHAKASARLRELSKPKRRHEENSKTVQSVSKSCFRLLPSSRLIELSKPRRPKLEKFSEHTKLTKHYGIQGKKQKVVTGKRETISDEKVMSSDPLGERPIEAIEREFASISMEDKQDTLAEIIRGGGKEEMGEAGEEKIEEIAEVELKGTQSLKIEKKVKEVNSGKETEEIQKEEEEIEQEAAETRKEWVEKTQKEREIEKEADSRKEEANIDEDRIDIRKKLEETLKDEKETNEEKLEIKRTQEEETQEQVAQEIENWKPQENDESDEIDLSPPPATNTRYKRRMSYVALPLALGDMMKGLQNSSKQVIPEVAEAEEMLD